MSNTDWIVLILTLGVTIIYGIYKSRGQTGAESYILAGRNMPWHTVLLGIMATQASAITFISGPGQAYTDGMRFIQYYFGLPLAMIVISAVFIPIFQRQKVFTAYQYLDERFDRKTRLFTGILFLFSRGVSTGMSVYAPAIVLSAIFGWNIYLTNILTGGFLILYTFLGGAQAVAHTQKIQFLIILAAMLTAGILVVHNLPAGVNFSDALYIAGKSGKLNVITTRFDWNDRYNIWSGIIGGFFLALSYFGTDQSQVGRYLTGRDLKQARMGILMNGIVKIPMQFFILLIGALLFSLFTFIKGPVFYNESALKLVNEVADQEMQAVNMEHHIISESNKKAALKLTAREQLPDAERQYYVQVLKDGQKDIAQQRAKVSTLIEEHQLPVPKDDTNYVFLYFVKHYLPVGIIGLVFAIIFLASWGSISAALNSLASATLIDFHLLFSKRKLNGREELRYGRIYTLLWGVFSIIIAMFATRMGSLIEAVNVLGSLFYGAILGIFLTAFFLKRVRGTAVFYAAMISEGLVFTCYYFEWVGFLWLNVIGALAVIILSLLLQMFLPKPYREQAGS